MVKILVIGSGAREHVIIKSLNKSKKEKEIYCLASNNNPGISDICKEVKIIDINNAQLIKDYSIKRNINIAIIGPEDPLAHGRCRLFMGSRNRSRWSQKKPGSN